MRGIVAVIAALLGLWSALPAFAQSSSDRAALDRLFAELKSATDAQAADLISQQIWQVWTSPSDKVLADRMKTVMAAEQSGDLPGAMRLLQVLNVDYPFYAEGWNQRATIEYQLKDFAASLSDIDRVLVYLAEGDRPKALAAMLAALAVDPFLAEKALFPELSQPAIEI